MARAAPSVSLKASAFARIGAIPQHARPGEIRDHFLEKLQPFCRQFPNENRASSNVPARVSKTRDQPSAHWVDRGWNDDRYRRGRVPSGKGLLAS
jgi:hypothetical protein